jgi:DNA-binding NtrC family response regulator
VIAYSADSSLRDAASALGMHVFLWKPVDFDRLLDAVESTIAPAF